MSYMRAPRSRFVALLVASVWLFPLLVTSAAAKENGQPSHAIAQSILVTADGSVRLAADAQPAPEIYGSFQSFGLYDSAPTSFSKAFNHVRVRYQRSVSEASLARVDVRARGADGRWSEWRIDVAPDAMVSFGRPMRAAQYRVVLLSNNTISPSVSTVRFTPSSARSIKAEAASSIAPTYRLRVTRQGMVGGRTANGHIITENDVFVSLPSPRALSSLGGDEYQVRLSANGRSIIAPVYDLGPWNYRDDYWNVNRETYRDLPVGWPQDHAAYYEGHNGGKADKGAVRFPTAVDIGDGAYWALGLDGAQATVNVTFLWLGKDPGPDAPPLNSKPSERPSGKPVAPPTATPTPEPTPEPTPTLAPETTIEINDGDAAFSTEGVSWGEAKGDCGYKSQAHWTTSTDEPDATDQAIWRPSLRGGSYDVFVYVPSCSAPGLPHSRTAQYIVVHAEGSTVVPVDQARSTNAWIKLGRFKFAPGVKGYVQLRNTSGADNTSIWVDALRWEPVAP